MFDKYLISKHEKEYIPYVKTEQRAPTDDSIRLFNEFRDKAYNSIIDTIQINNNMMSGTVLIYKDPCEMSKRVRYKIILNGEEIKGDFAIEEGLLDYKREVIFKMCQRLSDEITKELLKSLNMGEI